MANTTPRVALLVIDMQENFRNLAKRILPRLQTLIQECHYQHVPIFYTQHGHKDPEHDKGVLVRQWGVSGSIHYGSEAWKLMPELKVNKDKGDIVIDKDRYDAFQGTQLEQLLRGRGIDTVIIAGVMTNLCCESTARGAFHRDFNVRFLKDVTATRDEQMQAATELNLGFGFATIQTSQELLSELEELVRS